MDRKFWRLLRDRAFFGVRQLAAAFDAGSLLPAPAGLAPRPLHLGEGQRPSLCQPRPTAWVRIQQIIEALKGRPNPEISLRSPLQGLLFSRGSPRPLAWADIVHPLGARVAVIILLVILLVGCRRHSAPELEAFRHLPADRLATWQVDVASLRRSLLPLPPELAGIDRVSGVITTDRRTYAIPEPGFTGSSAQEKALILKLRPGPMATPGPIPDVSAIPSGAQFWMLADPRAFSGDNQAVTLTFGNTTVDLPADLVTRAQRLTASGHAGATGMDLTIDTEYSDAADPQRLVPSVGGVLRLARGVDTQVSAQGNHILIQAKVGPVEAGKLLLVWMTKN